jgi:hypothetical protein
MGYEKCVAVSKILVTSLPNGASSCIFHATSGATIRQGMRREGANELPSIPIGVIAQQQTVAETTVAVYLKPGDATTTMSGVLKMEMSWKGGCENGPKWERSRNRRDRERRRIGMMET